MKPKFMMKQKLKNDALWCKITKNLAKCFIYEARINLWCVFWTLVLRHRKTHFQTKTFSLYCWKNICFVSIKIPLVSNNNVAEHWEKIYSTFRIVISWSQTRSSFFNPSSFIFRLGIIKYYFTFYGGAKFKWWRVEWNNDVTK